ncbi:MAG: PBP1A family penicillin-binding protein [Acetobacteraceae bacterium]|nr:PBP1A family penicillin-binding protein [Acetobacteraceae bacterium]
MHSRWASNPPVSSALRVRPRRSTRWRWVQWGIIGTVWTGLAAALLLLWFTWDMPRPESALDAVRRPSLALEDRSGRVIATYGDVVGETVHLSDLPPYLPAAVVAVEDRRFWSHGGLDFLGMGRAMLVDLRALRLVQGGSTITQQVAKTLFLSNARTLRRKVQEALLTLWLERKFTKRELLEIWLNRVYLGSGAWGVDAAARMYFGVPARRLALWQAAVIAGLPRAPSRFNPRVNPEAAASRARDVLAAMAETGALTPQQAQAASAQIRFPAQSLITSRWFADWASEQAEAVLAPGADAILRTTLDSRLQALAESRLRTLLDGPGLAAEVTQGAVVVLDATSGAVRAMVGGRDYRESPYNRAVLARRQPGSAFKPFVWLAALERGVRPGDSIQDSPIRIGGWSPANFDRHYVGKTTVEQAFAQSINTVAVRLELAAGGPQAVAAVAQRLGIADRLPENASLALGTGEVGVLELAAAYLPFFNGGLRVTPYGVEKVRSKGRTAPAAPQTGSERVIAPEAARVMAQMLAEVVSGGSGQAAAVPGQWVAGKTGTTQDYRDAWFVGYARGDVIAVWLGNDDNHPMRRVSGGGLPARLFGEIARGIR